MVAYIWIIFTVIILVVFIVLKVVMKKQAVVTKFTLFLFIALMLTVGYVYTVSDLKIESAKDVVTFTEIYFSWIFSASKNVKTVTANVVEQDWGINKTGPG